MDELVRGLISNNYLITPPAYFLLSEHYNKDFALPELIKFAKARGTFVIDQIIAEEFLKSKGILSQPNHLEKFLFVEKSEKVERTEQEASETSGIVSEVEAPTGMVEESIELSSGTSAISEETEVVEKAQVLEEGRAEESLEVPEEAPSEVEEPIEAPQEEITGNFESESSEEENGGNGEVERKIIFEEYGVPIVAEEEEIPEEKKTYSVYADFKVTPKDGFKFIAKSMEPGYNIKFDVRDVKVTPPKARSSTTKEGEIIVKVYENYFKSRLKKMRKILRENPEVSGVIDIGKLSYINPEGDITIIGLVNSKS